MKLTDILTPDCVKVPLTSTQKTDVICELVDLLAERGKIADRDTVREVVLGASDTFS